MRMAAAARDAPAGGIAELHQDDFPVRRQRQRMRAEGARPADAPGRL
jgi:hypothetical protein